MAKTDEGYVEDEELSESLSDFFGKHICCEPGEVLTLLEPETNNPYSIPITKDIVIDIEKLSEYIHREFVFSDLIKK